MSNSTSLCLFALTDTRRSLLSPAYEIALLLLSSWIHIKDDTDLFSSFFVVVAGGLNRPRTEEVWAKVLKTFMSDATQAAGIIRKCAGCLRRQKIDSTVTHILIFIEHMINSCDHRIFGSLYESWIRLLLNTSRACDRQLCQYDEDSEWRSQNVARGIIVTQ